MVTAIIVISSGLFGLLLWMLFLLIRTSKSLTDKNYDHDKTEIFGIVIILLACIIVLPWFFTKVFSAAYNFQSTGQIGDTIGGITAPFINGIGAILVYIAFKEQVKSSKAGREEKRLDLIVNNLNKLDTNPYEISVLCANCIADLNNSNFSSDNLVKLTRILREFESNTTFIASVNDNRDYLENKFYLTWKTTYEPHIKPVNDLVVSVSILSIINFMVGDSFTFNQTFVRIIKTVKGYI